MNEITVAPQDAQERRERLVNRLQQFEQASVDAVADTRRLILTPFRPSDENKPSDVLLAVQENGNVAGMAATDGAHHQLREKIFGKVQMPQRTYDELRHRYPEELCELGNQIMHREPEPRMLRMLRREDGLNDVALEPYGVNLQLRAFLSDAYRPINHVPLLQTLLREADRAGAWIKDWSLTYERFLIRFVTQGRDFNINPNVHDRPKMEALQFGAAIWNSETGHSAMSIEDYILRLACINGLIVTEKFRITHLGRRLSNGEDESYFQIDTRRLDDAAIFLKARDRFRMSLASGSDTENRVVAAIAKADNEYVVKNATIPAVQWIGNVGRNLDLTEDEQDVLTEEWLGTGGVTQWDLTNAVTATARRIGEGNARRGYELEQQGFKILTDDVQRVLKLTASKN
jgi:hypothetical protein